MLNSLFFSFFDESKQASVFFSLGIKHIILSPREIGLERQESCAYSYIDNLPWQKNKKLSILISHLGSCAFMNVAYGRLVLERRCPDG